MRSKIIGTAAAVSVVAAALAAVATAGSASKQQRIAIAIQPQANTFVLTPLSSGSVKRDSGTVDFCCWTSRTRTRDGQSIEIDNPKGIFKGKHGTFTWREQLTFADSDNGYTIATGVWKIVRGTGAYAHLQGHGRDAVVSRTASNQFLASKAEGLFK